MSLSVIMPVLTITTFLLLIICMSIDVPPILQVITATLVTVVILLSLFFGAVDYFIRPIEVENTLLTCCNCPHCR